MKDYESMTDFELNLLAARKFLDWDDLKTTPFKENQTAVAWGDGYNWYDYDPCHDWRVAGELIESHGIGVRKQLSGMWVITQPEGKFPQYVKSPRRGIVIVALMMEEANGIN